MNTQRTVIGLGILLLLITGGVHLLTASDAFEDATYKGVLFVLNGLGALAAVVGILRGRARLGWGLGIAVAGGALVAYVLSRTVGLPGLPAEPDAWLEPLGVVSLAAEAGVVAIGGWLLAQAAPAAPAAMPGRPAAQRAR